jgi:fatty-acid peroxygenase
VARAALNQQIGLVPARLPARLPTRLPIRLAAHLPLPDDSTVSVLREGYAFIGNEADRRGRDVFTTRLLGVPVICMRGPAAARLLYTDERLTRKGAMPPRVLHTLLGTDGVQGLDGQAHRHRKAMFLELLGPGVAADSLVAAVTRHWRERLPEWEQARHIVLNDEMSRILTAAVCEWAGVPLTQEEVPGRAADLVSLIESPAAVGPKHWPGRLARLRLQQWTGELVERVRQGGFEAPGTALEKIALFTGADGRPLPRHTASVELLNVLRPTVAIARFVVFVAMALHSHRRLAEVLRGFEPESREVAAFVEEVRRTTPFFPATAARVRTPFEWQDVPFPEGRLVVVDLFGTDRDPGTWPRPEEFLPARFEDFDQRPNRLYKLVPQGAGDHAETHRCPGEWATVGIMRQAVQILGRELDYDVPAQDLRVSLRRAPALPRSGFVMSGIQRAARVRAGS